ncbi:MAG TPA: pilus assembly protein TadE [Actinobacteria bacterium]|jgi:hypothetical protein|nr:pilus assembly protein TadE [Actinomycetota bacterium]
MMPGRSADDRDAGSALIEFLIMGIGILIPLAYLALAASAVQAGVFASTQAVREAGRAFVTSSTPAEAGARAEAALRLAFDDHAITPPLGALRVTCEGGPCLSPGTRVLVEVAWEVPLPWLPSDIVGPAPALVPIRAEHRVPVDDFRGAPA